MELYACVVFVFVGKIFMGAALLVLHCIEAFRTGIYSLLRTNPRNVLDDFRRICHQIVQKGFLIVDVELYVVNARLNLVARLLIGKMACAPTGRCLPARPTVRTLVAMMSNYSCICLDNPLTDLACVVHIRI